MCGSAFSKVASFAGKIDPIGAGTANKVAAKLEPIRDKMYRSLGMQQFQIRNAGAEAGGASQNIVTKDEIKEAKANKLTIQREAARQGTTDVNGLVIGKVY